MGIFNKKSKEDKQEGVLTKKEDKKPSMKDLYGGTTKPIGALKKKTGSKKDLKHEEEKKSLFGSGRAYKVLLRPVITEKAADLGAHNKYVFAVADKANKIEISKAVNELYGVQPTRVNIIKVSGKKVRQGKYIGKRRDWKKAIVTLPQGKTIKIYEGV